MPDTLFRHRLRVSPRGRNVRLREMSCPPRARGRGASRRYDVQRVPALLERKKHWIRAALERAKSHQKFFEPQPTWRLPLQIKLTAVGTTWHVTPKKTEVLRVGVRELVGERLLLFGAISDERACRAALARWLMKQTHQHLVPRLQTISLKTGLPYKRALVKRQKTRWASCSRRGIISLNAKLLFLPGELVDYVMTHELCHVAEMNHSKRFWRLVERHSPNFYQPDSRLREMWKTVPRWAL